MSPDVHIAAVAARTPVGLTAESTAAAVRAGISRIGMHPFMSDHSGAPIRAAMDGLLDASVMGAERVFELMRSALQEIFGKLSRSGPRGPHGGAPAPVALDMLVGLPEHRPGWSAADEESLLQRLREPFKAPMIWPPRNMRIVGHGHASSLYGIHEATRAIASNDAELILVGGVDSHLGADTLDWLLTNNQLACADVRTGFFPGEGCGLVALTSGRLLRRLNLPSLGEVTGAHHAQETALIKTDDDNFGVGLTTAVEGATRGLRLPQDAVDAVCCDINGERYRSEEWGFAALRLPYACRDATVYEAPAVSWGDMGAASGALFAGLAVEAWRRGYARGPRALLWAGSEAGLRAAVVLQRAGRP